MSPRDDKRAQMAPSTGFRILLVAACVLPIEMASPGEGWAQAPRWEIDISGSRMTFDTMPALNAPSISTLAEWQRPTLFGRLSGSMTGFQGSGWSAQEAAIWPVGYHRWVCSTRLSWNSQGRLEDLDTRRASTPSSHALTPGFTWEAAVWVRGPVRASPPRETRSTRRL